METNAVFSGKVSADTERMLCSDGQGMLLSVAGRINIRAKTDLGLSDRPDGIKPASGHRRIHSNAGSIRIGRIEDPAAGRIAFSRRDLGKLPGGILLPDAAAVPGIIQRKLIQHIPLRPAAVCVLKSDAERITGLLPVRRDFF